MQTQTNKQAQTHNICTHSYTVVFTYPKPLPATTSLQLEPANNVFEPVSDNMFTKRDCLSTYKDLQVLYRRSQIFSVLS